MELSLDEFLPYRLSVASNKVSARIAKTYQARFGLSIPSWRVLAILSEKSPLSQLEISHYTAMDKVTVSRAVSGLLERGLIARKLTASDKRVQALSLTEEGQGVVEEIIPYAKDFERQLISLIGEETSSQLNVILRSIETAVEKVK